MDYHEWEESVPEAIQGDILWDLRVYRHALFVVDVGWQDVTQLAQDKRMVALSDQLYRALGSISANLAEGYSRGSSRDQLRFYEYALGSARESRDWYYKARHVLGEPVSTHRIHLLSQVVRMLLAFIAGQRQQSLKEDVTGYVIT